MANRTDPEQPAGQGAPPSYTWMDVLARVAERYVPDAITTAIILMVVLAGLALTLGNTVTETVDAYYRGLWMLLAFTMQMTLILTLSLVLADTRLFKNGVIRLSRLPRTPAQVVVGSVLLSAAIAYANWGLAL